MTEGIFPKADGDVWYGTDANRAYYQGNFCTTMNYASVNVTSTATVIKAANSDRKRILIKNNGDTTLYLGIDNTITTGSGYALEGGDSIEMHNRSAVYGITGSETEDIRYLEVE